MDSLVAKARRSKAGIILMGYEGLRRHSDALLPLDWGYVILDEGHRIRNPDAEITLLCKQVGPTGVSTCMGTRTRHGRGLAVAMKHVSSQLQSGNQHIALCSCHRLGTTCEMVCIDTCSL